MTPTSHHIELVNGVGKCSVPMWCMGMPAGFCDAPAYGNPERGQRRYDGFVPALACHAHGGPAPRHFGDPCVHCGTPHDEVAPGPCLATKEGEET